VHIAIKIQIKKMKYKKISRIKKQKINIICEKLSLSVIDNVDSDNFNSYNFNSLHLDFLKKLREINEVVLKKISNIIDTFDTITLAENNLINEYLIYISSIENYDYNLEVLNKSLFKFNYINIKLKNYMIINKKKEINLKIELTEETNINCIEEYNDYVEKLQIKIFKINNLSLNYIV